MFRRYWDDRGVLRAVVEEMRRERGVIVDNVALYDSAARLGTATTVAVEVVNGLARFTPR